MIIKNKWDNFFYTIASICAQQSECLSRNIGVVLAKNKRIVSTGYNGPPSNIPHCDARIRYDKNIKEKLNEKGINLEEAGICPRTLLGGCSGELLDLCPAVHAEANAIINAAYLGRSTRGTTMYMTCGIPCRNCLGTIINAGVREIVCTSLRFYDETSRYLLKRSKLKLRLYDNSEQIDTFNL